ncbi:hypothetical protein CIK05_10605 [Bdellovibrio sp. qaytius]|nr:hypothetical protein CIK05_10605 [Bdellovibrio sp. qaytius]
MKLFILTFFFALSLQAKVTVAFLELRNYYGDLIQLEQGGRFAHMAISYKGQWLHAHPLKGVEVVSEEKLKKIGQIKETIELPEVEEISEQQAAQYLGKPFDNNYSWTDDAIYCAELVGKLLNIRPTPMSFDASFWPDQYKALNGKLGLSPDDIFQILSNRAK